MKQVLLRHGRMLDPIREVGKSQICTSAVLAVFLFLAQSPNVFASGISSADNVMSTGSSLLSPSKYDRKAERLVRSAQIVPDLLKIIDLAISASQDSNPNLPPGYWEAFSEEVRLAIPEDDLVRRMSKIYQRHYDEKEMDALIAFFESPVGQKYIGVTQITVREAFEEIGNISAERMSMVMAKMRERGFAPPGTPGGAK